MAIHDRSRRLQSRAMCGLDDVEPFLSTQLVRADDRAHLIIKDLGRGAGQRAEASIAEAREEIGDRNAQRLRALRTSSGENAWTCMSGTAFFTVRSTAR